MKLDKIENKRLYAFLRSQTLNMLMLLELACLFLMPYLNDLIVPGIFGIIIFCLILGYSLWYWIKKPKVIIINNWLSNTSMLFTFYWFIVMEMGNPNKIWYLFPLICMVALFVFVLVKQKGFEFRI